ncbi:MAG: glycosyltransferase family 39 protein [Euryarchaeota archaeon]|nr:glycosyltransferase family 39 protein [Euryarchaeota archaeon]
MNGWKDLFRLNRLELLFLLSLYLAGLYLRLGPRLEIDPHLLTFQGDIWYRLTMAQYIGDHWALPHPDIRYLAHGYVPMWYPPLSPIFFAVASRLTGLDIPTVSSRLVPFLEALAPLPLYLLARSLYNGRVAFLAAIALALTPSFVFWTGISDPQSFTLFLIPVAMMLWIWHCRTRTQLEYRRLVPFGLLLALTFLAHLSFFVLALALLTATLALRWRGEAPRAAFLDLIAVLAISQAVTAIWWLPKNLYWWWINALVTSSGMYQAADQLKEYGTFAALMGLASTLYLLRGGKRHLIVLLWALPLFLETQNEVILTAANAIHLSWSTLAKPLEGFRFYPFLAQPFALAIGVTVADVAERTRVRHSNTESRAVLLLWSAFLALGLTYGVYQYGLPGRLQNSGLIVDEYEAALWFRANSQPTDRIIADYYRAQMFAGVNGGKALLGGMFPLRNVDYPYIKAPGQVQNDLYILYNTSDPELAREMAKRYGATHIFYSDNMIRYGNLLSYYKKASEYGVDIDRAKFQDGRYFEITYRRETPYGEVVIIRVK